MDNVIQSINNRFNIINKLIEKTNCLFNCDNVQGEVNGLELKFMLLITPFIALNSSGKTHSDEMIRQITAEGFVTSLDTIINYIIKLCAPYFKITKVEVIKKRGRPKAEVAVAPGYDKQLQSDIQALVDVYPFDQTIEYTQLSSKSLNNICVCGMPMLLDTTRSMLICKNENCCLCKELCGEVFEDITYYSHNSVRSKIVSKNLNRHFDFWMQHILATESDSELESKEMSIADLISNIKGIIVRDSKLLRCITVDDMRGILKEIQRTDLNKNIALLIKKITGIGPPIMKIEYKEKIRNMFVKSINTLKEIRNEEQGNRNYYPHYIYKIIDLVIPDDDYDQKRVMYYIYIQSRETVEADDREWEEICKYIGGEFIYKPTNRLENLKYVPRM